MSNSSPQASGALYDTLASVFHFLGSIHWSLRISQLFTILYFPIRVVLYPLRLISGLLLIIFAPAIYVFSFLYSIFQSFVAFLSSLEFGAAAGVGIFAGIIIAFSSSKIASSLGMYDDDAPLTRPSSRHSSLRDSKQDSSSTDMDWQWLDSPSRRRKPAVGLLSHTIHEEDEEMDH
ncbi:hypothetical protein BGZ63DRAFT_424057 [Mariannaea sp. PMI_226]|nr:hypothetical protein BGZ63DRAFT_424057 [Mariannaea sp. PMI_226]